MKLSEVPMNLFSSIKIGINANKEKDKNSNSTPERHIEETCVASHKKTYDHDATIDERRKNFHAKSQDCYAKGWQVKKSQVNIYECQANFVKK